MTLTTLNDPEVRSFESIVATYGYALDGIKPLSASASTW
jgi:hypothetical protein